MDLAEHYHTITGNELVDRGDCPICVQTFGETAIVTTCEHAFHETCLRSWLSRSSTCPVCRKVLLHTPPFRVDPVVLGRIRLLDSEQEFRRSFGRFIGDELNGFSRCKLAKLGQEADVVQVFADQTITCVFNDGSTLDFPWETVMQQMSVLEMPPFAVYPVQIGRVRLLSSEKAFRESFRRFPICELNGYSDAKLRRRGQECTVTQVFRDQTITCKFTDGATFDFPWETVSAQIDVADMPPFQVDPVQLGRVRLLDSIVAFRASFARFVGDALNGFSTAKLRRCGHEATVVEVFDDRTATCVFDDGVRFDFPWETIADQINVTDAANLVIPSQTRSTAGCTCALC